MVGKFVYHCWRAMFGTAGAMGATVPGSGVGSGTALAMEVVLTAGLVNTILGTASGARNIGNIGAIAVGGYVVGPVAGALIGVAFEWILKGKPTAAGAMAAQGSLGVEDSTAPER